MKKRILSLILVVIMAMSLASAFSVTLSAATAIAFTYNPSVYMSGEGMYNIVWKNNVKGIGYVTYKYNGKTYTVYDEESGIIRSDDYTHTVRVPMKHLDAAGSYTVNAAEVISRDGLSLKLGSSISISSTFRGYKGESEIKFSFFSDSHLTKSNKSYLISSSKNIFDNTMGGINTVDVAVFNGDIANNAPTEDDFNLILEYAYTITEGKMPALYVKGNHECRGEYAQYLYKYLSYTNGEFFTMMDYGPISIMITDIGEDKEDDHEEYGGLNDMDHYLAEQLAWVSSGIEYSKGSRYHVAISHSPTFVDRLISDEIINVATSMGTDVLICGHSHQSAYYDVNHPRNKVKSFPVVHDGGHNNSQTMRSLLVTFSNDTYNFDHLSDTGTVMSNNVLKAKYMGSSPAPKTEEKEEVKTEQEVAETETFAVDDIVIPTSAGVSTAALKGAADSTAITTKPVVFDSGDYYNVVWQTTPGIAACGYVDIKSKSGSFTYTDSVSGKVRTDTTHSVKIPKDILNGSTYSIKSRVCTNYNMYGYVANPPTTYGAYAYSASVDFVGSNSSKSKYNILAITNLSSADSSAASQIASSYKITPDLIVSLGNVAGVLNTEDDFGKYLKFMASISANGRIPVLYVRGENESKGEFAANINKYIRNTTAEYVNGKFYSNFSLGNNISIISLDTATGVEDSTASKEGYAAFDTIRKEQVDWMAETVPNIFASKCNIVFAHASNLSNCAGVDLTKSFVKLKTNLVVTGQTGKASLNDPGNNYAVATVGTQTGDGSYGLMITCTANSIDVTRLGSSSVTLGTVDTAKSVANDKTDVVTPPTDDEDNNNTTNNDPTNNENETDNTNNGTSNNGSQSNNSNNSSNGTNNSDTSSETEGQIEGYKPGEYDGISGDLYIREVEEGWYNDYLGLGFTYESGATAKGNGTMSEGTFVLILAKCSGVNLSLFYDEDSNEDRASAWIESCGLYNSYVGGSDVASDNIVTTIVEALFTV